jgi:hypothetical protein
MSDHELPPPFPIKTHHCGEPIPDLAAIPQADRLRALAQLSPAGQGLAIDLARAHLDPEAMGDLILNLPRRGPGAAREAAQVGAGVRDLASPPPAGAAGRRDGRQINFRLTEEEHRELTAAGRELNLRPAQLARMLALNGARRILYDARSRGDVTAPG